MAGRHMSARRLRVQVLQRCVQLREPQFQLGRAPVVHRYHHLSRNMLPNEPKVVVRGSPGRHPCGGLFVTPGGKVSFQMVP